MTAGMTKTLRRGALLAAIGILAVSGVALAAVTDYNGTTSQKVRVSLKISTPPETAGKMLTFFSYLAYFQCAGSTRPVRNKTTLGPKLKIKAGRFSGTVTLSSQDHATIQGTVSGSHVSGSFSETYTAGGQTCATGKVTYSANKTGVTP